ncbi:MAG: M48 family metalloprotease [Bacteroidota bacterium]
MRKLSSITAYLLLFALLASCARNPVTGKKELSFMSPAQELALGKQSDPQIVASFGLYEDEKLQAFINQKGQQMAKISHRPDLKFSFKILDSPVVNAFAVPGGYVYFTRGIMAHFNNEAEFAGVLGHEIGHVTARHSAKQYTKQTLGQIALIGGLILSPEIRQYAQEASQGMQLLFLKFGRNNESQSDRLGVEYSTKIGYDAQHMSQFFRTIHRITENAGGERLPNFMSTHPDPLDRYAKVGELTKEWQAKDSSRTSYKVGRNEYLRMLEGMVYGEDPRQGYVENNVFYHPELKFQYPIPRNWKTQNSPQQVQMASADGKAMMLLQLAQEKTAREAANAFVTNNKLRLVDSRELNLNGMKVTAVISDQVDEQQTAALQERQAYQQQQQSMSTTTKGNTGSKTPTGTSTNTDKSSTGSKTPTSSKIPDNKTPNTQSTPGQGQKAPKGETTPSRTGPIGSSSNSSGAGPRPQGYVAKLRISTYAIEYNGLVYLIHGLSQYTDFARYVSLFRNTQENFKVLRDASKINVVPEKLYVKSVASAGTLQSALAYYKMPANKMKELAILNGMALNAPVKKGDLIKIVKK